MSDWNIVLQGGAAGVLFIGLMGILTRRIVPGWVYDETKARCDKLELSAAETLDLARRMTSIIEEKDRAARERERTR